MTKSGRRYNFGNVIIAGVQFVDTFEVKKRPALVLFEEYDNIVCAVITSNPKMKGISVTKKEGMSVDSVIKLNYIFTISEKMIERVLLSISKEKREEVKREFIKKLN